MIRALALLAAGSLLFATLAGFFGSRSWVLDHFAHFRPQYALGLGLLAVAFAIGGDGAPAALCGSAAAVNLALVAPLWLGDIGRPAGRSGARGRGGGSSSRRTQHAPGSSPRATGPPADPPAPTLSLRFLNVDWRTADPQAVLEYVGARADDLVVLLAVSPPWLEAVRRADLGLHAVAVLVEPRAARLIALARHPDANATIHQPMPGTGWVAVELELELEGHPLRALATHARSPKSRVRAELRDAQLAWIAGWAERQSDPVVVLGDLNATPWSHALRKLENDAGLVNSLRGHGHQPSWPARLGPLGIPIDHVLHGPELVTVERTLDPAFGSDHRMVCARLAWRTSPP